jgi:hypothetical protein
MSERYPPMPKNLDAMRAKTFQEWADAHLGREFRAMYSGFVRTVAKWEIGKRGNGIWLIDAKDEERTYISIPERFKDGRNTDRVSKRDRRNVA